MNKKINLKLKTDTHKIALYIRVSTEEQAENPEGSIRNQEDRLRATVNLKNMEGNFGSISEVFIDRARSGKDTNRPELQRMLAAIRRQEVSLVMVSELSRLSRSIKDFAEIWEMMRAHGCGFHSLRENFDTTTAAGEMVLYTVANIAQFERRQVSERVSANFQARAARGLYNGGVLPVGYKLIQDKPGFLEVDEQAADNVRAAFKAFLKEETLSKAAKWLNKNGYMMKRETQGGNHRGRLGYFTTDNLHHVLRNKAYIGIRRYLVKGIQKECKATWPAIIDEDIFNQAQKILTENFRRKKSDSESRWPFQLTGLVHCSKCNDRMVGKSAHGNGGKIPYYEHGWSTRRQACLVKPVFDCKPFRLQAKKLEPAVWETVSAYLRNPKVAEEVIAGVHRVHKEKAKNSEAKRIQEKIKTLEDKMEILTERLAELPKAIPPTTIYKQMEKIEGLKTIESQKLAEIQKTEGSQEQSVPISTYQDLLQRLSDLAQNPKSDATRGKIIKSLVSRIEITEEGFRLHFYAGRDQIERELVRSSAASNSLLKNSLFFGSNSLTNGGPYWT